MRPRFKPRRALSLVLPFAMAAAPAFALAFGQDDDCGPVSEVDVFHPDWVDLWNDATNREVKGAPVGSPAMMHTPPDGIPWDRLRYLDAVSDEPIEFLALARDVDGIPYVKSVVLEDPVLMVTFDQNISNQDNPAAIVNWESYRPLEQGFLQEYVVNPSDGETNQWFTPHRNGSEYLRTQLGLEADCFNSLTAGDDGCRLAITQGLASVGVYWAGGPLTLPATPPDTCVPAPGSFYEAYAEAPGHLWWRDRLLIFVADRSSFIRPSFNPTTTRDEPGTDPADATNDGIPRWDGDSYVFPTADDPVDGNGPSWNAYFEATRDFVGYIADGQGPDGGPSVYRSGVLPDGSFQDGFQAWHEGWRAFCWSNASCPYYNWPFSGIGITANWTQMPPKGAVDFMGPYSANSEFISIGEKPIYLVAIREAHEYLGSPGPDAERRTWCDVCPGDYDQDGRIGGADLATLLLNWGSGNLCLTLDRTDPIVDGNDLALLLANWNRFCEWPLDWRPEDCGD